MGRYLGRRQMLASVLLVRSRRARWKSFYFDWFGEARYSAGMRRVEIARRWSMLSRFVL
jgi:hypothetical protein